MLAENGEKPACELPRPSDFETRVVEQVDGSFILSPKGAAGRVVCPVLPKTVRKH